MFAVEEPKQIPDRKFVGKCLRGRRATQRRHGPTRETAACRAEKITRDAPQIRHSLRLSSIQHATRYATPERPAPVVFPGKTRGRYQMINLQVRQVYTFRAACEQTPVHILVLTGQQPPARAAE